jgi:ufm1-conjugating enzyme 1
MSSKSSFEFKSNATPRSDAKQWAERLKEEYRALIAYIEEGKRGNTDWFRIEAVDDAGLQWRGRCWHVHEYVRYEFDVAFELPSAYPKSPPDIRLPQLDGMTPKMYKGAKICLTVHFHPLWARNNFGIVHVMMHGLAPWLAAEIPVLAAKGKLSDFIVR